MKLKKALITAAGWGTRFLPITKTQPKEMLPLVDKPVIQYAVEEAIASGIKQILVVTAQGKHAIENYFDRSWELESFLAQRKEDKLLEMVQRISELTNVCYIRQKEQRGLGNAVLTAKDLVGEEPFALLLPDDVCISRVPVLKQMIKVYQRCRGSVLAVQRVKREDISRYGIIRPKELGKGLYRVLDLVEKPQPAEAPSDLGIVGRYILTPQIFTVLEATPPGKNHEVQLTDALKLLLQEQAIYAYEFEGERYDVGTPVDWLKATIVLALRHPEIGPQVRDYFRDCLEKSP